MVTDGIFLLVDRLFFTSYYTIGLKITTKMKQQMILIERGTFF
jgi:hypothetical protein